MFPFKKKNKEEEEDDESISGRRSSKDGDDNEETTRKRKKKEPPKPWGKKERKLVFIVFMVTVLLSGMLAASARSWKLPGFPRIKIPSVGVLESETVVITKKSGQVNEELVVSSEGTKNEFQGLTKDLSGVYGLYVIDLESGYTYSLFEDEVFEAASLIKLPVMIAMLREAEDGNIDLSTEYILKEEDKIGGSGSLQSEPAGTVVTYQDLVRLMANQSDNTAFGISKSILGEGLINETINNIGMINTSLETNETSLTDMGLFFRRLWEGELVNKEHTDNLFEYLSDTTYEEWLAAGVSGESTVSHKYGREVHVVNDAGIVFTDNPYVVVILTKGVVEREADKVFPDLSRIVYEGQTTQFE